MYTITWSPAYFYRFPQI